MAESSPSRLKTLRGNTAISPFPTVFSKDMLKPGLVWDRDIQEQDLV